MAKARGRTEAAMPRRSLSALDDPTQARHAWARFRRLMVRMALLAAVLDALALAYMGWAGVPFHLHLVLAVLIGLTLTVMLGTALMLLGFMSAATGHDAEVQATLDERDW